MKKGMRFDSIDDARQSGLSPGALKAIEEAYEESMKRDIQADIREQNIKSNPTVKYSYHNSYPTWGPDRPCPTPPIPTLNVSPVRAPKMPLTPKIKTGITRSKIKHGKISQTRVRNTAQQDGQNGTFILIFVLFVATVLSLGLIFSGGAGTMMGILFLVALILVIIYHFKGG